MQLLHFYSCGRIHRAAIFCSGLLLFCGTSTSQASAQELTPRPAPICNQDSLGEIWVRPPNSPPKNLAACRGYDCSGKPRVVVPQEINEETQIYICEKVGKAIEWVLKCIVAYHRKDSCGIVRTKCPEGCNKSYAFMPKILRGKEEVFDSCKGVFPLIEGSDEYKAVMSRIETELDSSILLSAFGEDLAIERAVSACGSSPENPEDSLSSPTQDQVVTPGDDIPQQILRTPFE